MKKSILLFLSLISFGVIGWVILGKRNNQIDKSVPKSSSKKKQVVIKDVSPKRRVEKEKSAPNKQSRTKLNARQEKLLELLNVDRQYTMNDIEVNFPEVHVRTLRRDLAGLQQDGLIEKLGSTKASLYQKL